MISSVGIKVHNIFDGAFPITVFSRKRNQFHLSRFLHSPSQRLEVFSSIKSARTIKTLQHSPLDLSYASKNIEHDFMDAFPDVVKDLTEKSQYMDVPEVMARFKDVLEYNVPYGKRIRGQGIVLAYQILARPEDLTKENIGLSQIMGWCAEVLSAYFHIMDDILDKSTTRRGRPCWYRTPGTGMNAINDSLLVENGVFQLLKRHFHDKPYYVKCIHSIHDFTARTLIGQILDCTTSDSFKDSKLKYFTMDRFKTIANYKTGYQTFEAPMVLAMHMAGIDDEEIRSKVKTIAEELGQLYQIQDDFIDCFGDPKVTGKSGTDIQDAKCTWIVITAHQKANSEQRKILEECYGSSDPDKINEIIKLYQELNLPKIFALYEEEIVRSIRIHISRLPSRIPIDSFYTNLLGKLFKRVL